MVAVCDAPFVTDSILDARAKARHPSKVRGRGGTNQFGRRVPRVCVYGDGPDVACCAIPLRTGERSLRCWFACLLI